MQKEYLQTLVGRKYTIQNIANDSSKSKSTVRYWLKKYGLKTFSSLKTTKEKPFGVKLCKRCSIIKSVDNFYKRRKGFDISTYCKPCTNIQTINRQRKFKEKCIKYKGSCCQMCNYKKYNGALEFHHLDPTKKDFSISSAKHTKFDNRIIIELDKCILLCSNCHKEVHAGLVKLKGSMV